MEVILGFYWFDLMKNFIPVMVPILAVNEVIMPAIYEVLGYPNGFT